MARLVVLHQGYGCETGCCGHIIHDIDTTDPTTYVESSQFEFEHPYGMDHRQFAEALIRRELGEEHVKDLDWDNCEVYDD